MSDDYQHPVETIRERVGVTTQSAWARLLGISYKQYRRVLTGHSDISEASTRLAQAYDDGYRPDDWDALSRDRRTRSETGAK